MTTYLSIDSEFNNYQERNINVICLAVIEYIPDCGFEYFQRSKVYDTTNYNQVVELRGYFHNLTEDTVILSYAAVAETRSLLSLGINPLRFKWVDILTEFKLMCNGNNRYQYGKYIDKNGKFQHSEPPRLDGIEDEVKHLKKPKNLINCVYSLLGEVIETDHKRRMIDIILSKDSKLIQENIESIKQYCLDDTKSLFPCLQRINAEFHGLGLTDFGDDQLLRGRYSVLMGICTQEGLPIDLDLLARIIKHTPKILESEQNRMNSILPNIFRQSRKPEPKLLKNGKIKYFKEIESSENKSILQDLIESLKIKDFPKTDSGLYSTDKKTLWSYSHIPQILEYLQYKDLANSLKWFNPKTKEGFIDALGSDGNVRPNYNPFGTQTGRNGAKAKAFPLLMSKWLRSLIKPSDSEAIVIADFSQQEFYIGAALSGDMNMMECYTSGDAYLHFAKLCSAVPLTATKQSHKATRDLFKGTVLGEQFGMGIDALWTKLKADSGNKDLLRSEAERMDRYHKETFRVYWGYINRQSNRYKARIPLLTPLGTPIFCDIPFILSIRNFPIQGTGADICRLSVDLASNCQLMTVLCQLHDAIIVKCLIKDIDIVKNQLEIDMKEATRRVLREKETNIRIDFKVITSESPWIEEAAVKDWGKFKGILYG